MNKELCTDTAKCWSLESIFKREPFAAHIPMLWFACNTCIKHFGRVGAAGICIVAGYFLIFRTDSTLSKNVIPDAEFCPALIRQVAGAVAMLASVLMTVGGYHPKLTKIWIFLMTVAIGCMIVMEAIFYTEPTRPLPKLGLGISMFGGFYAFVGYEADKKKLRIIGRLIFALPLVWLAANDVWGICGAQLRFDMTNLFRLFGVVAGVVSGIGLAFGIKVHVSALFMCVYLFHEALQHWVYMTNYQIAHDLGVTAEELVMMWRYLLLTFIAIAVYGHEKLMGDDRLVNNSSYWQSSSAKRIHPNKRSIFDISINYFMKYFGRLLFAGMIGVGGYCLLFVPQGRAVLNPETSDIFCQIMGCVAIIGALLALPGNKRMSIYWVLPTMVAALVMGVFQGIYPPKGLVFKNGIVNISMFGGIFMLIGYELENNFFRRFGRLGFAAPLLCQAGYFTYIVMQVNVHYDMDFAFRVFSQCVGVIGGSLVAAGFHTHIGAFFLCGFLFHESMHYVLVLQGGETVSTSAMLALKYLLLLGMTMALFGHDRMHEETVRITGNSKWTQKLVVEAGLPVFNSRIKH